MSINLDHVATRDASDLHLARISALEQLLDAHEKTVIAQTTRLQRRSDATAFLADATARMSASLDPDAVLSTLAAQVLPAFADWCAIDVIESDGSWRRLALRYSDLSKRAHAEALSHISIDPARRTPATEVLRTGKPLLIPSFSAIDSSTWDLDDERRHVLEQIAPESVLIVPLVTRDRTIGLLSLATAGSGRTYDEFDLSVVQDLASRAGLAVENARLYRDAREAELRFRELVEGLDAIVWETDEQGTLRYVSTRVTGILGYSPRTWLDRPDLWRSAVAPEDQDAVARTRAARGDHGATADCEYRARTAMGTTVWLRDIVHLHRNGDEAPRVRGITVDITKQKVAQLRAACQHQVARTLAGSDTLEESAPEILEQIVRTLGWDVGLLWLPSADRRTMRCVQTWCAGERTAPFIDASGEVELAFGQGLPGRVWMTARPAWISDVASEPAYLRAEDAHRTDLHASVAFPISVGHEVVGVLEFLSGEISALDDATFEFVTTLGGQIGQYIERARAEEALRLARSRKAAMMDASLDAIIIMDVEGAVTEFNPAAERMFGYTRDDVIGRRLGDVFVPKRFRAAHHEGLAHFRRTGEAPVLNRRLELAGLRSDGSEFPIELAITRVDSDEQTRFIGFIRDITERHRAEAALRRSRERSVFLAEAGRLLAGSLDPGEVAATLTEIVVPVLGDQCFVHLVSENGSPVQAAASPARANPGDADPAALTLAAAARDAIEAGAARAARASDAGGDAVLASAAHALGAASALSAPLSIRGKTLGTLTMVRADPDDAYGDDDLSVVEALASRGAMALNHAHLYAETAHISRVLQRSLLPPDLPHVPGLDLGAVYEAAGEHNQVGGDFYDVFPNGRDRWVLVVGDVCGKGADAAVVTALARYTIRAAGMQHDSPAAILATLNDAMLRQPHDDRYCTVVCAVVERTAEGARCRISSGGHPAPAVVRFDGSIEQVPTAGMLVGLFPEAAFRDVEVSLAPRDSLVMFTDGVTEARDDGELFGREGLERTLGCARTGDASSIAGTIARAAMRFQRGHARDDIALLVAKVNSDRD